jgi:signal transduction histidine kinase
MSPPPFAAGPPRPRLAGSECLGQALDWLQELLLRPDPFATGALPFLAEVRQTFAARGAGLAALTNGTPDPVHRVPEAANPGEPAAGWPWEEAADLLGQDWSSAPTRTLGPARGSCALAAGVGPGPGDGWLLWLEDDERRTWGDAEKAVLALTARLWARGGEAGDEAAQQARFQRRIEEATVVTRRLAHDFGNVLTGVIGFAELVQAQLPRDAGPHAHLGELLRSAQQGARLVQKLSAFSRRPGPGGRSTGLRLAAVEEVLRVLRRWGPAVVLRHEVPADLPALAIDGSALAQVVGQLLDNACEAVADGGVVTLAARAVELDEADCRAYLGRPRPGNHVEVTVTDTGPGVPPDVRRRLLGDLFYTTKPGHRGYGLAAVYGILQAHQGGFLLRPAAEGGTEAQVVLPRAAAAPPGPRGEPQPSPTFVIVG